MTIFKTIVRIRKMIILIVITIGLKVKINKIIVKVKPIFIKIMINNKLTWRKISKIRI